MIQIVLGIAYLDGQRRRARIFTIAKKRQASAASGRTFVGNASP